METIASQRQTVYNLTTHGHLGALCIHTCLIVTIHLRTITPSHTYSVNIVDSNLNDNQTPPRQMINIITVVTGTENITQDSLQPD
mgnify:CR=1 FL=1